VLVARAVYGIGVVDARVVVGEVPAVDVVHVAVTVVVDTVARHLAWVLPDVVPEVGVAHVHALVYHRDDGTRRAGRRVPGLRRIGIGVRGPCLAAYGLPGVVQTPEPRVARIVRRNRGVDPEVRLGVFDVGRGLVAPHGLPDPEVRRQVQEGHVAAREVLLRPGVGLTVDGSEVRLCGVLLEPDDHLPGDELLLVRRREGRLLRRDTLGLGLYRLGGPSVSDDAGQSRQ
jgi:hypothetical protein